MLMMLLDGEATARATRAVHSPQCIQCIQCMIQCTAEIADHRVRGLQAEVAFDTMVLECVRPGYRCVQLRSPKGGTRIELCALLLHVAEGDEVNMNVEREMLRRAMRQMHASMQEKDRWIEEHEGGARASAAPHTVAAPSPSVRPPLTPPPLLSPDPSARLSQLRWLESNESAIRARRRRGGSRRRRARRRRRATRAARTRTTGSMRRSTVAVSCDKVQ